MMFVLVIIAVLLVIAAAVQLLKVSELAAESRGKASYEISEKENKTQAKLLLLFLLAYFAFFAWQVWEWGDRMLPVSASEHGVGLDNLLDITFLFIIPVFVVTHIFLFWFCFKYAFSSTRKAAFFSHSTKLELIWTIVPAVALTVLILYGLSNWNSIMKPMAEDEDKVLIELYGQQFSWTARYAGDDEKLGRANVEYIEGINAVGVDPSDPFANDDRIVKGEFHLPVNKPVQFVFRSQDVIHSAYMPHFRAQMNCVPGMKTQFNFTPTITSEEMKKITNNKDFTYVLLCNKICGAAHYNMQMDIIVESQEDYDKWLAEQKQFGNQ